MTKMNYEWNDNKLNRFLKEGRGQGEGKEYKPWLTIQDRPSLGRVSRVYWHKTQRIYHFFSDNETRMFYLLAWENEVTDIREFYPLLNMAEIIKDKRGIELDKFKDKETGTPYVFTTTFLVTYKDENSKDHYIARSVKSSYELEKKYVIEKFEVERRYWESKGIDWGIITQKDIPVVNAQNIEWVYSSITDQGMPETSKDELSQLLLHNLDGNSSKIRNITSRFDNDYNFDPGTGLFLFKYLIATKRIIVNMDEKININLHADEVIHEIKEKDVSINCQKTC
jgi:hypothetical protein